jgi:hypothetical protein
MVVEHGGLLVQRCDLQITTTVVVGCQGNKDDSDQQGWKGNAPPAFSQK